MDHATGGRSAAVDADRAFGTATLAAALEHSTAASTGDDHQPPLDGCNVEQPKQPSGCNEPLPYGRSHWDGKPAEIHAMILRAAGPLTLFVNGLLGDSDRLSYRTKRALWTDAFEVDWDGDLALLPDVPLTADNGLCEVRSRSMYARLCARFPDRLARGDVSEANYYSGGTMVRRHRELLLHVPMRRGWFDLLDFKFTVWLSWMAIAFGHPLLLKHLVAHHRINLRKFGTFGEFMAMDLAARSGCLEVMQMLHDADSRACTTEAMDQAALGGHLDVVVWLHTNRTEGCTTDAMDGAAEGGHLDVIQWLHINRAEGCTNDAIDLAAISGHLDVIQWLHANRTEGCTINAMDLAAAGGHLPVVKWLHSHRTEGCTTKAMDYAARHGRLPVVQWLHANRSEGCTTDAMDGAAEGGYLDVVEWLHANRREGCTTKAMDEAAACGHVPVLEWLHANRTEGCTTGAMLCAAQNGHVDSIAWLHRHRPDTYTPRVFNSASTNGRLDVLQCLLDCGYKVDLRTIRHAKDSATRAFLLRTLTLEETEQLHREAIDARAKPRVVEQLAAAVAKHKESSSAMAARE